MSNVALQNALFQLKFTAKQLDKQAKRAARDEKVEKAKVEKSIKQGDLDTARLLAQSAVRKQNEKLELMKLKGRVETIASRVERANTMQSMMKNINGVTRSMDIAMKTMNIERVSAIMEGFEQNFANLDVIDEFSREVTSSTNAVSTPQEDVDRLMNEAADKVGIELAEDLESATPSKAKLVEADQAQDVLSERLRALRN